jgi:hypothetical protein
MRVFPKVQHNYNRAIHSSTDHNPFRWGWDFNHWVPWMLHYPLRPPRKNRRMLQLELKNPLGSLSRSSTSSKKFRIFYRSPMPSTRNAMINTRCHASFRLETKFGCTSRKNTLRGLIKSLVHSVMDPTPSPRLRVRIILSSTFPHSSACTQYSMWTSFDLIFHHYWTPQR